MALFAAAYFQIHSYPFVFDDIGGIVENYSLRKGWPSFGVFQSPMDETPYGRPLVEASLGLNYAWSALVPAGYHLFNILLHLALALVLYHVFREILQMVGGGLTEAKWISLLATGVWMVHPLQTSVVTYTVQRAEGMMSLAFAATLLFGLISIRAGAGARRWECLAIGSCLAGVLCKESMFTAPLAVLLADVVLARSSWRQILRRRFLYTGLFASWLLVAGIMVAFPRKQSVGFDLSEMGSWEYLQMQCQIVFRYFGLVFWPAGQSIDYAWEIPHSLMEVLPYALVLVAILGVGVYLCFQRKWWGYCLVIPFLILAPTSSIVPIVTSPAAEHRMYLASAFFILPIVYALFMALSRRRLVWLAAAIWVAAVLVLTVVTYQRNRVYRSEVSVWSDVLSKQPKNARAANNLGRAFEAEGRTDEAIRMLTSAIKANPGFADAFYNLGTLLGRQGNLQGAEANLLEAARLRPSDASTHCNLGLVYFMQGRKSDAYQEYKAAVTHQPSNPTANFNLAVLEADKANWSEARSHLEQVLVVEPNYPQARNFLRDLEKVTNGR